MASRAVLDTTATAPRASLAERLGRAYGVETLRGHGATSWLLAGGTAWSAVGNGAVIPFIAVYLTAVVGIPLTYVGVGVFAQQIVRALASPVFGGLSDRFGRKPLMVLGLVLQGVTMPLHLLVATPGQFILVSCLAGFGQAPYHPALNALLADVTAKERRVSVFGLVHMMRNFGWLVGILVASALVESSFAVLFVTGGVFPLVYAAAVAFAVREPARAAARAVVWSAFAPFARAARSPRFLAFLAAATTVFLSWGQLNAVLPVFVADGLGLGTRWVTAVLFVNAALVLVFQVPVSARAERWVRANGIAFAGSLSALAYIVLAFLAIVIAFEPRAALGGLIAGTIVLTFAEMLDTPLVFAMATDLAPAGMTGGAMGVLGLAAPVGMGAAPFLAGIVGAAWGWTWVWLLYSAIVLAGAAGFLAIGRRVSPTHTE